MLVALAGIGAGYTVRAGLARIVSGGVHSSLDKFHLRAEAAPEPRPAPADANTPVIRFVKNPEMAPPLPEHDISGAPLSLANWSGKRYLREFLGYLVPSVPRGNSRTGRAAKTIRQ